MIVNQQIYSRLGDIGASPYFTGAKKLNSQYAKIEKHYERGEHGACVEACSTLFEQLMGGLYLSVMGEEAPLAVILSDIDFWQVIDDREFCDRAGMLQYACYRIAETPCGEGDPEKEAELAKSGLEDVIEDTARFLSQEGDGKCLDPAVLAREDVREAILALVEGFSAQLDAAGCSGGVSMQPPYMNAILLDFPERETAPWARFIAQRLKKAGLLTSAKLRTLDAEQVVLERVGLTNEFIRRASAEANGGALLIEHFEEFDMPCLGGNLMDRALQTILTAADNYRGSLCIVVSGMGERVEKTICRTDRAGNRFPLALSLREAKE